MITLFRSICKYWDMLWIQTSYFIVFTDVDVTGSIRFFVCINFIMFIAGILVCIRKSKDDIALGLRYRDDSG